MCTASACRPDVAVSCQSRLVSTIARAASASRSGPASPSRGIARTSWGTPIPRCTAGRAAIACCQPARCEKRPGIDPGPARRPGPAPVRQVGDGMAVGQSFTVGKVPVEHAQQAAHLAPEPVEDRWGPFGPAAAEDVRLAHHRADPARLEHQPPQNPALAARAGRQEAAGLFGKVDEDRAGFEDGKAIILDRRIRPLGDIFRNRSCFCSPAARSIARTSWGSAISSSATDTLQPFRVAAVSSLIRGHLLGTAVAGISHRGRDIFHTGAIHGLFRRPALRPARKGGGRRRA